MMFYLRRFLVQDEQTAYACACMLKIDKFTIRYDW